ncbi:MAG: hypothetical protein IJV67_02255 [Clostridia bacterium]|nr:hypothetical protein [Clostridia bacterium]
MKKEEILCGEPILVKSREKKKNGKSDGKTFMAQSFIPSAAIGIYLSGKKTRHAIISEIDTTDNNFKIFFML